MRGLGLFLTLCAAVPAFAQDAERLPLVGVLRINSVANNEPTATLLRDELAALGDVDGKNIRLDFRLAEGDTGRFPELAEALVRENATVIVAQGPAASLAAQRATRSMRSSPPATISWLSDWSRACRARATTSPGSAS